jgi:hypothetical protein
LPNIINVPIDVEAMRQRPNPPPDEQQERQPKDWPPKKLEVSFPRPTIIVVFLPAVFPSLIHFPSLPLAFVTARRWTGRTHFHANSITYSYGSRHVSAAMLSKPFDSTKERKQATVSSRLPL